jgi:predicted dehydrogenase
MTNRRTFIKQSGMAGAGLFIAQNVFSFVGSPNEKVVVGVMGTNSRGFYLARMLAKLPNVEVGYICDVDENVVTKTLAEIEKETGKKPKAVKDVRSLVETKDMDALVIAAPDHWHAPAALLGVKAGKHVYVEKPCSHSPAEGEMLVAAASKYNKLIQMGSQRRSFPKVVEGLQALKEGVIGRVYFAKGWYANGRKPIGIGKQITPPSTLDFELWQGPAPRKPYKDNLVHYNWHWFWHWGTAETCNNASHELDCSRWFLAVDYPTKVTSTGGRYAYKDDWETPDTQTASFEFGKNKSITWEGRSCNNYPTEGSGRGFIIYGDKGTLINNGNDDYKIVDHDNKLIKEVKTTGGGNGSNTISATGNLDSFHFETFLETIRGNRKIICNIEEGHKSVLLCHLANIAQRTGRTLHCNPANGRILNDPGAMKLWKREYEKGWEPRV